MHAALEACLKGWQEMDCERHLRIIKIKMMKTQSEKWFEDYCANSRIPCKRIPEEVTTTPDFWAKARNDGIRQHIH